MPMNPLKKRLLAFFFTDCVGLSRLSLLCCLVLITSLTPALAKTLYTVHTCQSLDPRTAISAPCIGLQSNLYERLTTVDDVTGQVLPGLAKQWALDPAAKTVEFELHSNRYWSDGRAVTAQDIITAWSSVVKHQLKSNSALAALMQIEGAQALADGLDTLQISGLSAPSEFRLRVQFANFDPIFHRRVASTQLSPIPHHRYAQYGERWASQLPLPVNGLYRVTQHERYHLLTPNTAHPNHQQLAIQRVESHKTHLSHTGYSKSDLRHLVEQKKRASYLALRDHIDDDIREFVKQHGWRIQSTTTASTRILLLNQYQLSPASIDTLKCAISSAEYVSRNQHEDLVEVMRLTTLPNLLLPKVHWQAPTHCPKPKLKSHKVTQAQSSHEKAANATDTLQLLTYFKGKRFKSNAALQAMLKPYNITLNSHSISVDELSERGIRGDYQLLLFSWQANVNDPTTFMSLAEASSAWLKPETKRAIRIIMNQANALPSTRLRLVHLGEAERLILEDGGLIPLATTQTHFLIEKNLCGFRSNSHELIDYSTLFWCEDARE